MAAADDDDACVVLANGFRHNALFYQWPASAPAKGFVMLISRFAPMAAAAALTLFVGHITDKTTGQPLIGVHISATAHDKHYTATTNAHGLFHLALPGGHYQLRLSSSDVPPQMQDVTVSGKRQSITLQACSTTLDYACGAGPGGGGA